MRVAIVFIFFLSFACEGESSFSISKENAVYESIFAFVIKDATTKIKVSNTTNINWFSNKNLKLENLVDFENESGHKLSVSKDLLSELLEKNTTPSVINWKPILVSATFGDFEYPEVHYQVSKVAFSKDGKKALVNFTFNCPLCGHSTLYFLELIEKRWVVRGGRLLWVS